MTTLDTVILSLGIPSIQDVYPEVHLYINDSVSVCSYIFGSDVPFISKWFWFCSSKQLECLCCAGWLS